MGTSGSRRLAMAQAAIVAASFAMLLAATNSAYPLLPVYRDALGLPPSVLSLTFSVYVGVFALALLVLARPRFSRFAAPMVLASLVVMLAVDLLMLQSTAQSILIGRSLAGLSTALGTGAASALVVAAIGAGGRSVTATGNTAGAIVGVGSAQLLVSLLADAAPQVFYVAHAIGLGVLLVAGGVVLRLRRAENRAGLALAAGEPASLRVDATGIRALVTGSIAWIATSIGGVLGATVFNELGQPLAQAWGPIAMLLGSAVAQACAVPLTRFAPWVSGLAAIALGAAAIVTAAAFAFSWLAIIGFVLLGAGVGTACRISLITLTLGASPARQGALASLYAGVTYIVSAGVVLLVGGIGDSTGLVPAALATFCALAVLALAALLWSPRLRDTVDAARAGSPGADAGDPESIGARPARRT
ncbi:hypothetical protein [Agrococcus baldri]|uniref:MFS transporter n=1 Tax=Agrococcus baldri TaxID=153730 RepID=A0AA87RKC6_9MICO|nr:hypothetical protein [Agrococcus baldri]GEK79722.1 hypothetical protein ABA31_10730 [Agrococcus baldri]